MGNYDNNKPIPAKFFSDPMENFIHSNGVEVCVCNNPALCPCEERKLQGVCTLLRKWPAYMQRVPTFDINGSHTELGDCFSHAAEKLENIAKQSESETGE